MDLYDDDIVTWCEAQAALLRRMSKGETPHEPPDWANIIEEIEALGRSETRACTSALMQMLYHEMKLIAWPDSTAANVWREEVWARRFEAAKAYAPSMRRKIDIAEIYARALREFRKMPAMIDGTSPLPVPETCARTLEELLGEL